MSRATGLVLGPQTAPRIAPAGLVLAVLLAGTQPAPAGEFQLWTELGVETPIAPNLHVGARSEVRFTDGASRVGLYSWNVGLAYAWRERFIGALEFLREYTCAGGGFATENRPQATFTWADVWRGIELSDRNKFEGRWFEGAGERFRYRNRAQAVLPLRLWPEGPRPFVSEEIFIETGAGFNQNRFSSGLVVVAGPLVGTVYGMLLSTNNDGWTQSGVLGFNFTYSFGAHVMMPGDGGVMMLSTPQ